jgi:peptide/nickel transport system ATP-binding protein
MESRLDLATDRGRRLQTLPGEPADPRDLASGCPFGPRCAHFRPICAELLPPLEGRDGHFDACLRRAELGALDPSEQGSVWPPALQEDETAPALRAVDLYVDVPSRGFRARRRREATHILAGVDLDVDQGEAVAVVGESGSGKTTLIRAAAGLMSVSGGLLEVDDARPQVIFQDAGASLTPWLRAGEQVADRLRPLGLTASERRARVEEAFGLVGLPSHLMDARPSVMSGGQRQRVAIARAVVEPPRLLLCDEPTSALDVSVAASALNLLGDLRRKLGMALIFVTHDLAVARLVADRIAVMYLGRIVEVGSAEILMREPIHPYTRSLLASIPGPGATHEPLPGESPSLFDPPGGCPFHPRCPSAREGCEHRAPNLISVSDSHFVDCVLAEDD